MLVPDYAQPDFLFLPERAAGDRNIPSFGRGDGSVRKSIRAFKHGRDHLSFFKRFGQLFGFSDMEIFLAQLQFDLISLFPVFQQGIKFFP